MLNGNHFGRFSVTQLFVVFDPHFDQGKPLRKLTSFVFSQIIEQFEPFLDPLSPVAASCLWSQVRQHAHESTLFAFSSPSEP